MMGTVRKSKSTAAIQGAVLTFARVLRAAIEEDNGLILRVATYEQMVRRREKPCGWAVRLLRGLGRRSRKIFDRQCALGALEKRNESCH